MNWIKSAFTSFFIMAVIGIYCSLYYIFYALYDVIGMIGVFFFTGFIAISILLRYGIYNKEIKGSTDE